MKETRQWYKFMSTSTSICLILIVLSIIAILPVDAIKLGPTPTPVPTPTPEIIYVTILITPVPTRIPTTIPTPIPTPLPGSGLWSGKDIKVFPIGDNQEGVTYIARGDEGVISRNYPTPLKISTKREAYFWLFGETINLDRIFSKEVVVDSADVYHIYFSALDTNGLEPGKYKALVQFVGDNGKRDIVYDPKNERLDSIYAAVESTPASSGDSPMKIRDKLLAMLNNRVWCDDTYEEFEIRVEDPWISIDDSWSDGDLVNPQMHVSGATNLGIRNGLTLTIDADQQITEREKMRATRGITIEPYTDPQYPRNKWAYNFSTSALYPGKHDLTLKSPKFGLVATSFFELVESWPMLTPTPTPQRYIMGFPEEPTPNTTIRPIEIIQTQEPIVNQNPGIPGGYVMVDGVVVTEDVTQVPVQVAPLTFATPTKALLLNAKPDSPVGNSLAAMSLDPMLVILGLLAIVVLVKKHD
jgi:hypothetical protein